MNHTIPAVEKTVAIVTRLGERVDGMTQAELAAELDVTPSSCYRILQTLLAAAWVRKDGGNRYLLAPALLRLTRRLQDPLLRFRPLQAVLDELAQASGLSCKLSIREGDRQRALLRAESPRPLAVSGRIGLVFPLAEGSVGAALLAQASPEEAARFGRACGEELGAPEAEALLRDGIAAIRRSGSCFNRGQNRWKIDALSAPVTEAGEVVAALTLLGYDEDFRELPALTRHLAAAVEKSEKILEEGIPE